MSYGLSYLENFQFSNLLPASEAGCWKFDQFDHKKAIWPKFVEIDVSGIFENLHKNKNASLKPAFMEQLKYLTNSGSRNDSFA